VATYADHLAIVTVTDEKELPPSDGDQAIGEGYRPRLLTFRIDKVVWSRPGAPTAPTSFLQTPDGWVVHGDTEVPLRMEGEPDLKVDASYLSPIVYDPETDQSEKWSLYSLNTIETVTAGVVTDAPTLDESSSAPQATEAADTDFATSELVGASLDQVGAIMKGTSPDPAANEDLPPVSRYRDTRR